MLNLNIFFNPDYWLSGRKLLNKKFWQSSLFNSYYRKNHNSNKSLNSKLIISGPQKLVNNLLTGYRYKESVVFNKNKYHNYYFCNFDEVYSSQIEKICTDSTNKVLVGPLYTIKGLSRLSELSYQFPNLKIIVASESAKSSTIELLDNSIKPDVIKVLPVGIGFEKDIYKNKNERIEKKALIYFKGRDSRDLKVATSLLKRKNINYQIFEYGKYSNPKLLSSASVCQFGFIVGRTESQGIAINEVMFLNLPLFVYDSKINNYGGKKLKGTSGPYFDKSCGKIISDNKNIDNDFDEFYNNLLESNYYPNKYIAKELTHEAVFQKLEKIFLSF